MYKSQGYVCEVPICVHRTDGSWVALACKDPHSVGSKIDSDSKAASIVLRGSPEPLLWHVVCGFVAFEKQPRHIVAMDIVGASRPKECTADHGEIMESLRQEARQASSIAGPIGANGDVRKSRKLT